MGNEHIRNIRTDYQKFELTEEVAGHDPFNLFERWFSDALQAEQEANVMVLSTGADQPSSRIVLLKAVESEMFVFFTNYSSKKGQEIDNNPRVSLLFFWQQLQRQVRLEGIAQKVSAEYSDSYFYSRPIESQIGGIASSQSEVLSSRASLERKYEDLTEKYKTEPIVRPVNWGGYEVKPHLFEFWQGRSSRLHDRIQFSWEKEKWLRVRLNP